MSVPLSKVTSYAGYPRPLLLFALLEYQFSVGLDYRLLIKFLCSIDRYFLIGNPCRGSKYVYLYNRSDLKWCYCLKRVVVYLFE